MGFFNSFAERTSDFIGKAPYFAFCCLLVLAWICLGPVLGWTDELFHLLLNSPTTALTFLMMALLQNTQGRFERATNKKLNDIAAALADFLDKQGMSEEAANLREDVGIEKEV